jgi:D-alanyl-D-alanine carboxypeptidase
MNEKSEELGLQNTHFVNPTGLHDDNQYTTASDMAKILQCALSYPIFTQISSSISYLFLKI